MDRFRLTLLLFCSSLIALSAAAQSPFEEGTKWYHLSCCAFTPYDYEGYEEREYSGDTIIEGLTYALIDVNQTFIYDYPSEPVVEMYEYQDSFYRQSGDSVFESDGVDPFLFMDYGADTGDTWTMIVPFVFYDSVTMRIDSTEVSFIAGQMRRVSHASFQLPYDNTWRDAGPYVEGIGRTTGSFTFSDEITQYIIADGGMSEYCTVDVPSSPEDPEVIEECSHSIVGLTESHGIPYRIGKNPSDGLYDISFDGVQDTSVRLYSTDGRSVSSDHVMSNEVGVQVDIRSLDQGVYLLVLLQKEGGRRSTLSLVKH